MNKEIAKEYKALLKQKETCQAKISELQKTLKEVEEKLKPFDDFMKKEEKRKAEMEADLKRLLSATTKKTTECN